MQRMAWKPEDFLQFMRPTGLNKIQIMMPPSRIYLITNHWVPEMSQMHTNLVCAPGHRPGSHESKPTAGIFRPAFHKETCLRQRSVRMHPALKPDVGRTNLAQPNNRRIHLAFLPLRPAKNQSQVFLVDFATLHGQTRCSCRPGVFCHKDHPTGFAIQTVNDGNLPARGEFVTKQVTQAIPERPRPAGFRRVNKKARRFIHREQILILTHHPELRLILPVPATYC